MTSTSIDASTRCDDINEHDLLCRTKSEERPPRSPYDPHFLSRQKYDFFEPSGPGDSKSQFGTHTRHLSQDSATSFRTIDASLSQMSRDSGASGVHFSEQISFSSQPDSTMTEMGYDQSYSTHSLPRQRCNRHRPEFRSLPRRVEAYHYPNQSLFHLPPNMDDNDGSRQSSLESLGHKEEDSLDTPRIYENLVSLRHQRQMLDTTARPIRAFEEQCSGCESDTEQEIFIDFKPQVKPGVDSLRPTKKTLHKQISEGGKLPSDVQQQNTTSMVSASEEDLKTSENDEDDRLIADHRYCYRNIPIKDEGICDPKQILTPTQDESVLRLRREAFRKRSISTEGGSMDELSNCVVLPPKISTPTSPCLSVKAHSDFPSSDSLATDWTRDNSDGIWNESQATVLHANPR